MNISNKEYMLVNLPYVKNNIKHSFVDVETALNSNEKFVFILMFFQFFIFMFALFFIIRPRTESTRRAACIFCLSLLLVCRS